MNKEWVHKKEVLKWIEKLGIAVKITDQIKKKSPTLFNLNTSK